MNMSFGVQKNGENGLNDGKNIYSSPEAEIV